MSDLLEIFLNRLVESQLGEDPDFLRQEEAAHTLLAASPDPTDALRLVDAYLNISLRRDELASLYAFRLGFELGKECYSWET